MTQPWEGLTYSAVITVWFVATEDPAAVLHTEPRADRGFGRKLLAQLNPRWPITPIGEFPLNRSARPSAHEFYIGGYPNVTVIQTWADTVSAVSEIDPALLGIRRARDLYVIATGDRSDAGGFVHFTTTEVTDESGRTHTRRTVRRALSATACHIFEDEGLPESFESPYWSGERGPHRGGLYLPFSPRELSLAAQQYWLGTDISPTGPDLQVAGFAVDRRPEPRIAPHPAAPAPPVVPTTPDDPYDDYEIHSPTPASGKRFEHLLGDAAESLHRASDDLRAGPQAWFQRWRKRS